MFQNQDFTPKYLDKKDLVNGSGYVPNKSMSPTRNFREKADGGFINDEFRQYDTGSHKSGNDMPVDQFGNPSAQAQATVQGKENLYKGFVLSNTLTNPKTGNKFSTDAAKVNEKYPKARLSDLDNNALDFEMNQLKLLNMKKIAEKEQKNGSQMYHGGPIHPLEDDPMKNLPWVDTLNQVHDEWVAPEFVNNDAMVPKAFNPFSPVGVPTIPTYNMSMSTAPGSPIKPVPNYTSTATQPIVPGTSESTGLGTLDKIGLGLKGAALVGSVVDAVNPAEQEQLNLPDYSKSDNYMREATIDYSQARQDAIGVSNLQANGIRSMSGNAGQFMSRSSSRLAQLQDSLSRISEAQSNANSQLNLTKSQYEANKSNNTTDRMNQNRINNQQNQANSRLFDRQLMSDLSQIGTQFGQEARAQDQIKNNREVNMFQNNQIIAALNAANPNWRLNPEIMKNLREGKIDIDDVLKYTP